MYDVYDAKEKIGRVLIFSREANAIAALPLSHVIDFAARDMSFASGERVETEVRSI